MAVHKVTIEHGCGHQYTHEIGAEVSDGFISHYIKVEGLKDCPPCRASLRSVNNRQAMANTEAMIDKYIVTTQADGSKWAISLARIVMDYQDEAEQETGLVPIYGVNFMLNDLIIYAQGRPWCEVVGYAHLISPSPDGGPDYNWGWQHGDPIIEELPLLEPTDDADSYREAYGVEGHYYQSDEQEQVERAANIGPDSDDYAYFGW